MACAPPHQRRWSDRLWAVCLCATFTRAAHSHLPLCPLACSLLRVAPLGTRECHPPCPRSPTSRGHPPWCRRADLCAGLHAIFWAEPARSLHGRCTRPLGCDAPCHSDARTPRRIRVGAHGSRLGAAACPRRCLPARGPRTTASPASRGAASLPTPSDRGTHHLVAPWRPTTACSTAGASCRPAAPCCAAAITGALCGPRSRSCRLTRIGRTTTERQLFPTAQWWGHLRSWRRWSAAGPHDAARFPHVNPPPASAGEPARAVPLPLSTYCLFAVAAKLSFFALLFRRNRVQSLLSLLLVSLLLFMAEVPRWENEKPSYDGMCVRLPRQ